jgi:hypothetical protein
LFNIENLLEIISSVDPRENTTVSPEIVLSSATVGSPKTTHGESGLGLFFSDTLYPSLLSQSLLSISARLKINIDF